MKIGYIDFPEELLDAQQNGKLVIFAGAGVSTAPPANFPNFYKLVDDIAKGSNHIFRKEIDVSKELKSFMESQGASVEMPEGLSIDEYCKELSKELSTKFVSNDKSPDQFLGFLKHNGIDVHSRTAKILSDPDSHPTELHKSLVDLFPTRESLKIVTTNFDDHFTSCSNDKLEAFNIHKAPALPLGSDFEGLVYLHGTTDVPKSIVITDQDFSRAYISQGWARSFIMELFENYTVLFVGYSYGDTIMSYLTRGLKIRERSLFAFTTGDEEHWRYHGIEPVIFPKLEAVEQHLRYRALQESVASWAKYSSMGFLQHKKRIAELLQQGPPIHNSEDDHYLEKVFTRTSHLKVFTENAKTQEWVGWAQNKGLFSKLFQRDNIERSESLSNLSNWITDFTFSKPELLISIYEKGGAQFSFVLWHSLMLKLWSKDTKEISSAHKMWTPLLIQNWQREYGNSYFEYLLDKIIEADDNQLLFMLLEHLLEPSISSDKYKKVKFTHSEYKNKTWLPKLAEKFDAIAIDLFDLVFQKFSKAHQLSIIYSNASYKSCSLSGRSAIEPHEQNWSEHQVDFLIDLLRDTGEWLQVKDSKFKLFTRVKLLNSDVPTFRRVGVYLLTEDEESSASEKLSIILENKLIQDYAVFHEFFRLIYQLYPNLNDKEKVSLIEAGVVYNAESEKLDLFNFFSWLDLSCGGKCKVIKTYFDTQKEKEPQRKIREYPDLKSWSTGVRSGTESPLDAQTIKSMPFHELIDYIDGFQDVFMGPSIEGLYCEIQQIVIDDADWGLDLFKFVMPLAKPYIDIRKRVLWGWRESKLIDDQWSVILNFIIVNDSIVDNHDDVAFLIDKGFRRKENAIPEKLWDLTFELIIKLNDKSKAEDWELNRSDLLSTAINNTGGRICELLLAMIIAEKKSSISWDGLPNKYTVLLESMIEREDNNSVLCRVILGSQLHLFYYWDKEWTDANILPLFDWSRNEENAFEAWSGYLVWGRWEHSFFHQIKPFYLQSLERFEELDEYKDSLLNHAAGIYCFSEMNSNERDELIIFLNQRTEAERVTFNQGISHFISNLEKTQVDKLWEERLEHYIENRLSGIPLNLSSEESGELVRWAAFSEEKYSSIIEMFLTCPEQGLSIDSIVWHYLNENEVTKREYETTGKLLAHNLRFNIYPWDFRGDFMDIVKSVRQNLETNNCELWEEIYELLSQKGLEGDL